MRHDHGHGRAEADRRGEERRLALAAWLTGGFALAEAIGGLLAGSLALLADAGHMFTDGASLAVAWWAVRLARRPADWRRSYGFDRFTVLAAFVNGIALFAIAAWIVVEAIRRLAAPIDVHALPMLAIAAAGLVINVIALGVLHAHGRDASLNLRAAALHVIGDLLGSVAAIGAAVVILVTGWTPIDPLLSLVVAAIILRSGWRVTAEAGHILLEGVPPGLDVPAVAADLATLPEVTEVRHVHAWSIDERRPMMTLEVVIRPGADPDAVRRAVKERLATVHGVAHATVEVYPENGALDGTGREGPASRGDQP